MEVVNMQTLRDVLVSVREGAGSTAPKRSPMEVKVAERFWFCYSHNPTPLEEMYLSPTVFVRRGAGTQDDIMPVSIRLL